MGQTSRPVAAPRLALSKSVYSAGVWSFGYRVSRKVSTALWLRLPRASEGKHMWGVFLDLGEWAGAVAVFITLIYLVRQVRVNANQLEKQVHADLDAMAFSAYDPIYEGRNAEIMVTGLHRPEELKEVDAYVFDLLMIRHLHVLLIAGTRALAGEIPAYLVTTYREHYREVLLNTPGGKAWMNNHLYEHLREPMAALGLAQDLNWTEIEESRHGS